MKFNPTRHWKTGKGEIIAITAMSGDHLARAILLVERKAHENGIDIKQCKYLTVYRVLTREAKKRGLDWRKPIAKDSAWWDRYAKYLQSPAWADKREAVLKRDGGKCARCLEADASQVHHLTYTRVFNEDLADLISICDACHEAEHGQ